MPLWPGRLCAHAAVHVNGRSFGQCSRFCLPCTDGASGPVVSGPAPAPLPADEFVTQDCPSLPGSRTSTPPYELLSSDSDDAIPDHTLRARKAACESATVTLTAGMPVAPVLTQRVLRLQILDCRVPMTPAVGPVSLGLPRPNPNLRVSLPLPQSAVSAPGPTPDPAQSPADEFLLSIIHLCLGPARRPPPTSYSRLTQMLLCPRRWVLLLRCLRLGRQSWPGLSRSVCQSRRGCACRRSSSRQIVFGRISMYIRRTLIYPLFDTSPVSDGDLSLMLPTTTQESISPDSEGEAESFS